MFDAPLEGWYAWLGLAVAAAAFLGVVASLPTAPPPDAADVAATVETVAAADPPAAARYRLGADAVRITTGTVALRSDGGTATARLAAAGIVPVPAATPLAGVVLGDPPGRAFDSPDAFADAVADARATAGRDANWTAGRTVHVRHVSWGETDVTLVHVP
ncbi:DUF7283 family protein [Halobaculum litoreum]|uniref:DUF7283 family protein n=1 Tax=Halobaculum litoreum TaxID=3031998 RepID=UPI0024C3E810|nr:hypothetical protein [Halobaculum sp. DT92]